ncbi:hypothetical protein C8R46DRAFT_837734, partial [Mycena filopes]
KRTKIIEWLSPINFFKQHQDISITCQEGTGTWFLKHPQFRKWKEGLGKTLWCHGIPGAGKTVLASLVVDHLSQDKTTRTACIYLNHKETIVQTPVNSLAAVWRQLVLGRDISQAESVYQKHFEKNTRPTLAEIQSIVNAEVQISKVYIVVDAVDEYPEDDWKVLLKALSALGPACNLMMTSRPHITPNPTLRNLELMEIHASIDDIQTYLKAEIERSSNLSRHLEIQPTLAEEILTNISNRVEGMFLLAKLHIRSLATKGNIKDVRKALQILPKTLQETYADVLKRIDNQSNEDRDIAKEALSWITNAKQVLSVAELQDALAIESGTQELDKENLTDIKKILSVCAGLIIVDEHLSVVRLMHYTTQEYMDSISLEYFPGAQTKITRSLLTFLS